MGENVRQGDEKAKNLKQNLSTYNKHKETSGDVPFAGIKGDRAVEPRA